MRLWAGPLAGARRSRAPRLRFGLRTKTVVLVLACVTAPLLAAGFTLLQTTRDLLGDRVRETLSNQLELRSAEIDAWFTQRLSDGGRWSMSFVVVDALRGLGGESSASARARTGEELSQFLRSLIAHYEDYESLAIVSPDGALLAATREETVEPWVREALPSAGAAGQGRVSALRRSDALGRPTLLVLQPIRHGEGPLLGHLLLRLRLAEVTALLGRGASPLAPPAWLLAADGTVLARAGVLAERPGEAPFPAPGLDAPTAASVHEAVLDELGACVYATRPLAGPFPGRVAITVPTSVAYDSLQRAYRGLQLILAAAIGLGSLLSLLVAHAALRRVLRLSEAARQVAAGDLSAQVEPIGSDELAELTRAFNGMTRGLRDSRASLEQARDELARANLELVTANRALEEQAITDSLTGLYNRRHFEHALKAEIDRATRAGQPFGLLLMDLDHFKAYNDNWGHTAGDAALKRVAGALRATLRRTDTAFRHGGEEFAALLPVCPARQAAAVAEKLRDAVARLTANTSPITLSIGVAAFPADGREAAQLVEAADEALYAAKEAGRNRVVVHDAAQGSDTATGEADAPAVAARSRG